MSKKKIKVAVAMSGGIDSSVVTAILKDQGYDVCGVTMHVWPVGDFRESSSISATAVKDAKKVAAQLGIEHHIINLSSQFADKIVEPFCREYLNGRTPNPCIHCNRLIKFAELMHFAQSLQADYLATGHYVRVIHGSPCRLRKGVDQGKDQSYFLSRLRQNQLERILTPLGEYRKDEVK